MAKVDWCHRQSYYRLHGDEATDPGEKFSWQMETIFAEGHEIHRKWQQWLKDMGRLWGTWSCGYCDIRWVATSPDECPNGHADWIVYREVPLEAEEKYFISGHEDGADEVSNSLIEIKSIGMGTLRMEEPELLREYRVETKDGKKIYDLEALWKGLKHPLLSHRKQTGIYLALAKEMGLPFDKITFLYEYKATQSVKAFTIGYDERLIHPLLDKALAVKYALAEDTPPPRPAHTGKETKVCKTCPYFTLCYADDEGSASDQGVPVVTAAVPPRGSRRGSGYSPFAGDGDASQAPPRSPRTAGRSYRSQRQRVDEHVLRDPSVG